MNTSGLNSDLQLRVGTAQRERALEVLRNAAADERITFDELEGRVPRALGAVTRGDLAGVLGDLLPGSALDEVIGGEPALGEGPGYSWDDPLMLEVDGFRALTVVGAWEVPPFIEVHASIGGVLLDFTQAEPRSKIIDLVLMVSDWGTTLIVVPEGWGVDTQGTQAESTSTIETRGVRTRATPGKPRIILRGRTSGVVKVRVTKPSDVRRAERLLAKGRGGLPALER